MTSPVEQAKTTGISFDINPKIWTWFLYLDNFYDIFFTH